MYMGLREASVSSGSSAYGDGAGKTVTVSDFGRPPQFWRFGAQAATRTPGYGKVCVFIMNVENYNVMSSTENTPPDSTVSPPP